MTILDNAMAELALSLDHRPPLWTESGPSAQAFRVLQGKGEASVIVHRFVNFAHAFTRAREFDLQNLDTLLQDLADADPDVGRRALGMIQQHGDALERGAKAFKRAQLDAEAARAR